MSNRRPHFTKIPQWLNVYHPGKISVKSHEFHFYISRSELDQPVTLHIEDEEQKVVKQMKMYYSVERDEQNLVKVKDDSSMKDFSYLVRAEQEQINRINLSKESVSHQSSWIKTYQPFKFRQLLSDELINRNVLTWLKSWDPIVFKKHTKVETVQSIFKKGTKGNHFYHQQYNYKKLILLSGPPGCGKTTLARVIARHCGYHWEEINASDDRSGKTLISKIDNLVSNQTIRKQKKPVCVIIDEVDGALDSDSNGIKQLLAYIQTGDVRGGTQVTKKQDGQAEQKKAVKVKQGGRSYKKFEKPVVQTDTTEKRKTKIDRPIIFICNDPYAKALRDLRSKAIVVYFNTLQQQRVVNRLKQITDLQQVYIESQILTKICQMCSNDVRSSIGLLELLVRMKRQLNISSKQIINRMRFSSIKDVNATTNQFLTKVMLPQKGSNNAHQPIFKDYQYSLSQHDNLGLLSETFFHNLLCNKYILFKSAQASRLYKQIALYDVFTKQNFSHFNELSQFGLFPYAYYRIFIKSQDHKKIQFPAIYFQKFNKAKANKAVLEKIAKGIPISIATFLPHRSLVVDYLYVLWLSMQTSSVRQEDVLKCCYKMLTYGFKLGPRNSPTIFLPEIDFLLTFGIVKPEANLSNNSRNLIEENYEFLKVKSQLAGDSLLDGSRDNLESVINQLKKNRRRKRDSLQGQVKYKYLQGTGTEVKYDLKIGHFFSQKMPN